jgi:hypothetical protein
LVCLKKVKPSHSSVSHGCFKVPLIGFGEDTLSIGINGGRKSRCGAQPKVRDRFFTRHDAQVKLQYVEGFQIDATLKIIDLTQANFA